MRLDQFAPPDVRAYRLHTGKRLPSLLHLQGKRPPDHPVVREANFFDEAHKRIAKEKKNLFSPQRIVDALRATPVVMCTTSAYDKDMERAKRLGALGYLTKPAEMNRLKPLLDRIGSLDLRRETNGYTLLRAA